MNIFTSFAVILTVASQVNCNYECKNAINKYIQRRSLIDMVGKIEEEDILKHCNVFNFDDAYKQIQSCSCITTHQTKAKDKPIQVVTNYMIDFDESDKINCHKEYNAMQVATDTRNYDLLAWEYEQFYLCKKRFAKAKETK
ncbi:hypothetical protein TcasGA2_TC010065 [Tribolium castaneum]|uniref:Uncharacterized protein n=1 Tax=Tribolium castaneum TaxID=7070 RepID=D6WS41_TRICA|nr:PREDICTED: uncharacterized protein LOC103313734 [Tribolium castaneum]EFA07082.2 hypothetical protein TcasGA2_TC010065 [Tribolium castaneum]|eukprot:XP_008196025.1 PREDICTED: uncharacterized protein LOC103313734 [Tribolium castaneum]